MKPQYKALKTYWQHLTSYSVIFPCPHCHQSVLPRHYESHCTRHHQLNAKLVCVWCDGAQTWKKGEKNRLAGTHLLECWQKFQSLNVPDIPPPFRQTNLYQDMCPAKDPLGRSIEGLYLGHIFPTPADPVALSFGHDHLDLAASYLARYLRNDGTLQWFHAMVSAVVFGSFWQALQEDGGRSTTLPFWCWCDGGTHPDLQYRRHRHMIVVAPQGHFRKQVWAKVGFSQRGHDDKSYNCKRLKEIVSAMHLVNTLGYLCKPESRCNFSFRHPKNERPKQHHFYIHSPLPTLYKYALVLLWEGGVTALLNEQFYPMPASKLAAGGVRYENLRWQIQVKDIPGLPMDLYFSVQAYTSHQFLYLVRSVLPLPPHQETRVHFYEVIGQETWFPSPHQQKCLRDFQVYVRRIADLSEQLGDREAENTSLKRRLEEREAENGGLKRRLEDKEAENGGLQRRLQEREVEMASLQRRLEEREVEIASLQRRLEERDP